VIAAEVEQPTSPLVAAVQELAELARAGDLAALRERVARLHPADVAAAVIDLPGREQALVFRALPKDKAGLVFSYLTAPHQEALIESLSSEEVRNVAAGMPADDRARLLDEMPAEVAARLMETFSPEELEKSRALLNYPENTAGRFMTPDYASIPPEATAGQALEHIRRTGRGKETLNVVYIVDREGHLLEDVRLGSLVLADPATPVKEIPDPGLVFLTVHTDRRRRPARLREITTASRSPSSTTTAACSASSPWTTFSTWRSRPRRRRSSAWAARRPSTRHTPRSASGTWCASAAAGWPRSSWARC
jgi:Mg/Co/Ni transporter MgtE